VIRFLDGELGCDLQADYPALQAMTRLSMSLRFSEGPGCKRFVTCFYRRPLGRYARPTDESKWSFSP